MCCFKLFGALSFLVIKKRGVKYRQYRLTYMLVRTVDTKTVAPPFFIIGFHSKWVMQQLLCWFP